MGLRDFNPLDHPLTFAEPAHLPDGSDWQEHVPFAFFLLSALRPELIVELSNRISQSYCAFCHAVGELELSARCRAFIAPGEDLYRNERMIGVRAFHDAHYGEFSSIQHRDFADAATDILDHTIDLLHIKDFTNPEGEARDFHYWFPKVSQRGIILISGVGEDTRNFEARQFWQECKQRHPHFELTHGSGMGMLAVGESMVPEVQALCAASVEEKEVARAFFRRLEQAIGPLSQGGSNKLAVNELARTIDELRLKLAVAEQRSRLAERTAHTLSEQLTMITNSRTWEMAQRFWRLRAKISIPSKQPVKVRADNTKNEPPCDQPGAKTNDVIGSPENQEVARLAVDYQQWVSKHEPSTASLQVQHEQANSFKYRPLISIITPVYRTPPDVLRSTLESVLRQTYDRWEICLVVGGSADEELSEILNEYSGRDRRVRIKMLAQNRGIAENTNEALAMAGGDFVALLDHDDEIAPHALFEYVRRLDEDRSLDVFYSDEDKLNEGGVRCDPFFKPDWSPEYFRGVMYVGHLLCFRRNLLDRAGVLNSHYDGVQDFELMLRLSEIANKIVHVPQILYHWRQLPGSIAKDSHAKPNISQLQCEAVNEQLARMRLPARAEVASPHHRLRIRPAPTTETETLSIIITYDGAPERLANCLRSIYSNTRSANYDVTVAGSDLHLQVAGEKVESISLNLFHFPSHFSHANANNLAARNARGSYLLFLRSDTEIITNDWIEQLIYYAAQKDVGAVGPLLLFADQSVKHAGTVLGSNRDVTDLMRGFSQTSDGYAGSLVSAREVSAVSAACLLIKNRVFHEMGGFNEHFFTQYHDVDLCLRLRAAGRRIIFTPAAKLIRQMASAQAEQDDALDYTLLLDLWQHEIERGDPYYNPNFDPLKTDYSLRAE